MEDKIMKELTSHFEKNYIWWNESNKDTFIESARKMLNKGFDIEEIKTILGDLYAAISNEYGN